MCITSHGIGNNLKSDPAGVYCDILRGAAVIDGVWRVDLAVLRERRGDCDNTFLGDCGAGEGARRG